MGRSVRYLLCFLCFFLDIRVRAGERLMVGPKSISVNKQSFVIDTSALVERTSADLWRLVRGQLYVDGEGRFQIKTPYAFIHCEGKCRALIERFEASVVTQNLGGDWKIERVGDKRVYSVPVAMQTWVSEVTMSGAAEMDFPQSMPWLSTAKAWARLYPGSSDDFKKELAAFRVSWKAAVESASELDLEIASREIASYQKAQDEKRRRRLVEEKENAELRLLFREKNYLTP